MNKWQEFITGTMVAVLMGASAMALAGQPTDGHERAGKEHNRAEYRDREGAKHRHGAHLIKKLDLSQEQQEAWREERARLAGDNRVERSELRSAHRALRDAHANEASDLEIAALRDQLKQLRLEARAQRQQQRESLMAILTPEQQQQLAALEAEHKARHREAGHPHKREAHPRKKWHDGSNSERGEERRRSRSEG